MCKKYNLFPFLKTQGPSTSDCAQLRIPKLTKKVEVKTSYLPSSLGPYDHSTGSRRAQTEEHETDKQTDRQASVKRCIHEEEEDGLIKRVLRGQTWLWVCAQFVGLFRHQRALSGCSHLSWLLGTGKKGKKCVSVAVLMLILSKQTERVE